MIEWKIKQIRDEFKGFRPRPEAEKYVAQDHVGRRERLLLDMPEPSTEDPAKWPERTTTEAILLMYFADNMNQQEIAEKLYISQQYVSKVVCKYRPVLAEYIKKVVVLRRK